MDALIKIETDENMNNFVSGRELHIFLEVKTAYKDWFPRMCAYGFVEGADFSSKMSESTGGRPGIDHLMTIDMAKQIAMIQRNEKGRQAREYFLQVEKSWNTPELVFARALQMANKKLELQKLVISEQKVVIEAKNKQLEEAKPKVVFADAVSDARNAILMRDLAKLIRQNGVDIGEKRLYKWMRENGYICTTDCSPTQRAMDMGLFAIKVSTVNYGGTIPMEKRTTLVTGKGQVYFVNKFLAEKVA